MVVGFSPALVMLLVGSLVWFLTIVLYHGDYTWRLMMVHGFFVMGVVATTRIAMEEGAAYASLFAFPLAAVVAFAYFTFVQIEGPLAAISPVINLALEGLIWFSAHKLTWDCTLIDDAQDSSKEGLLQAMGWEDGVQQDAASNGQDQTGVTDPAEVTDSSVSREVQAFRWMQSLVTPDKRPHTPGVWIIYFALAALPLFGIGQWFIPGDQVDLRRQAFWLLVVYVASSLGLLLNTSFLGLRRYLRQRNLQMPAEMSATWLGVGGSLIAAVLLVVWLLPRPSAEYSLAEIEAFKSKPLDPSKWGWGKDGTKKKSGERSSKTSRGDGGQESDKSQSSKQGDSKNQTSGKGKGSKNGDGEGSQGKDSQSGKSEGGKSSGGKGTGKDKSSDGSKAKESGSDSQKGESKSGEKSQSGDQGESSDKSDASSGKDDEQQSGDQSDSKQRRNSDNSRQDDQQSSDSSGDSQADQEQSEQPDSGSDEDSSSSESSESSESTLRMPQWLSNLSPTVAQIIRWAFYLLVLITLAVLGWKYRAQIAAAWRKLLAELRDFWARWFGGQQAATPTTAQPAANPPRPFATYADPFASGMAAQASLTEVVRYSFEALEAWGREHQSPRVTGQTAHEFAQQVGQIHEPLAGDVRFLAELYGQLAYAGGSVRQVNLDPLKSLWQRMRRASGV